VLVTPSAVWTYYSSVHWPTFLKTVCFYVWSMVGKAFQKMPTVVVKITVSISHAFTVL